MPLYRNKAEHYHKPDVDQVLDDYLKAVNELTINKSAEVSEQTHELATQMELKEREIHALKEQVAQSERNMKELKEQWGETTLQARIEIQTMKDDIKMGREHMDSLKRDLVSKFYKIMTAEMEAQEQST
jgi:tRNA U34 5-methylaminomethyl-2-thiouridine-forming methyltransferase MnmC